MTPRVRGERNCEDMRAHANPAISGSWVEYLASLDPYQSLTVAVCGIVQTGAVLTTEAELQSMKSFHVK